MNRLALSAIPNVEGFRFIGITKDDKEIVCYVMYNEIGNYDCHDEQTGLPCFYRLAYWRPL